MAGYDVLAFTEDSFLGALSNSRIAPSEIRKKQRAQYLFRYLGDVNAKTIIVEHHYVDGDYLDDVAAYYVKCFEQYDRKCKRLHFFSNTLSDEQFQRLVRNDASTAELKAFADSYLGFIVARPLPEAIIGRTVLKTYPSDGGRRHYTCTKVYRSNLFGIDLEINSLAYQEQDRVTAACATVSLWCSFHKAADLYGTAAPTPARITQAANQVLHISRPMPSHGLSVQQICNAIKDVHLEPEAVKVLKNVPLPSLIYGHVKCGLPVVLVVEVEGIGAHAITVAGYSMRPEKHVNKEVDANLPCLDMPGRRIDEFYGHDDQIGPFARIKVKPSTSKIPIVFEGSWVDDATGALRQITPLMVIAPVYPKIRVTFIDVQKLLIPLSTITDFYRRAQGSREWDVYLVTNNQLKKELRASIKDKALLQDLMLAQQPRFIWRATLRVDGVEVVDLLFDATDMAHSLPIYYIIWHDRNFKQWLQQLLKIDAMRALAIREMGERYVDLLVR